MGSKESNAYQYQHDLLEIDSASDPSYRVDSVLDLSSNQDYIQKTFLVSESTNTSLMIYNEYSANSDSTIFKIYECSAGGEDCTQLYSDSQGTNRIGLDTKDIQILANYSSANSDWTISMQDSNGNVIGGFEATVQANIDPSDASTFRSYFRIRDADGTITLDTANSRVWTDTSGPIATADEHYYDYSVYSLNISGEEVTPTPIPGDDRLTLETQKLLEPNGTYPFTVYYWPAEGTYGTERGQRQDVTTSDNTTIDIENVTVNSTQVLTLNASGDQFDTLNNSSVAETVNITATYDSGDETLNVTKEVVVAEGTVRNLAILPGGLTRATAVTTDNTILALIVAGLLSVAGSRFVNSFAGLSIAEMVIVVGWLGGYVDLGIAILSIFTAMFIGLNLAANIDMVSGRGVN